MSPSLISCSSGLVSFPRVSGDEPVMRAEGDPQGVFSPRERG